MWNIHTENVINILHCILYIVKKKHKIHPQVSITEFMKQCYQHLGIPFISLRTPFPNHEFINLFAFLYSFTTFEVSTNNILFSFACFWILYRWNHTALTLLCNLLLHSLSVTFLKFMSMHLIVVPLFCCAVFNCVTTSQLIYSTCPRYNSFPNINTWFTDSIFHSMCLLFIFLMIYFEAKEFLNFDDV